MADAAEPRADPGRRPHLGMQVGELDGKWYAKYWNPVMAPLPQHVREALALGPQAPPLCLEFDAAGTLGDAGHHDLENGYGLFDDGSMHTATLTRMPGVSPAMLDWWFWWHATETQRYKLWNPRAHVYAAWSGAPADRDAPYRERYIGGTSFVDEYVGSALGELAIRFVRPSRFGFSEDGLDPAEATAVCGVVGLSRVPLDWGYLIHHVRRVKDGSEMRSRFWMGGKYVAPREGASLPGKLEAAAEGLRKLGAEQARAMVVHCSQEMNHLAAFLPGIFDEFTRRARRDEP
ncbi:DAPG hydrolase family protein [Streptomyces angustmyceticus]|uniref:DAPG hydrolase family protein n=1 Tax=Streptomyces angustmyceticus TaxID=285578 RepID=UPI003450507F